MSHVIFSGLGFGEWRGSPRWRVGLYKLIFFGFILEVGEGQKNPPLLMDITLTSQGKLY